jgi:hypothetical protein
MDPSTKRILIILGIVVVIVVALFIVAVAYTPAGDRPGSSSGCSQDRRKEWQARLFGSKPVGVGQLRGCKTSLGPFPLSQGQTCRLTIAKADTRSRKLVIESAQLIQLSFKTDADGRKLEMKSKPKGGKPTEISISKDGQEIDFQCLVGNPCQIVLR